MAMPKPSRLASLVALRPQIATAIAPPEIDPVSPIAIVSHAGMGSGPGTASRASAPVTNPMAITAITVPNIGQILRRCTGCRDLATQFLDLVAQFGRIFET